MRPLISLLDPVVSLSELECKPIIIGLIVGSGGGSLRLVKPSGGADGRGGAGAVAACKSTGSRSPVDRGKGIKCYLSR